MWEQFHRGFESLPLCFLFFLYNYFVNNILTESERLIFRRMSEIDFPDVAEMLKNPNVTYAWEYVFDDIDILEWIKKNKEYYKRYGLGYFFAVDKLTSEVVGQIALMPDVINGIEHYEIGYILKERFWHKGYASEGVRAMIDYAFNILKLNNVIFEIRPENLPSRKVSEKCGAVVTGEFVKNVRGKEMKHLIYTLENLRS